MRPRVLNRKKSEEKKKIKKEWEKRRSKTNKHKIEKLRGHSTMLPPSSSLRAPGGARPPAVACSPSQGSRSRMSRTRVDALRDHSRQVPAQQRVGRSLSRLTTTPPPTTPTQRLTSSSVVVASALPSKKWPRRKRSPSPPRHSNNDSNDDIEIIPPSAAAAPRPPSLWRGRARARGHRHEGQRLRLGLPQVDWSRQNLQILFVDASGVTRARFAALLTERVGDWCGLGRALAPSAAGLYSTVEDDEEAGAGEEQKESSSSSSSFDSSGSSSAAALMAQASRLSLRPKALAAPRAPPFELGDLDVFDLIVAVDTETRDKIFDLLGGRASADAAFYAPRMARLGDFAACRSPGRALNRRGSDTLDEELAAMLSDPSGFSGSLSALGNVVLSSSSSSSPSLSEGVGAGGVVGGVIGGSKGSSKGGSDSNTFDVPRVPSLSGPTSGEDFDRMIERTVRGVAGLVQYLADGLPLDGDGGER